MKKNLKYLIIGGTAVASVIIVAAPIAATSKYTYPSDPLKVVSDDLNQITNAAFTQGTFDYKTKYADLKSEVLSKKQADGSWNVDGFIDFFKGQQNSYDKVSFADAKIKVADIKPIDDKQSFDVYFYVQSTKANDRGDFVKSSVAKATISFGYKPEFNLAAFAHDVTRASFTGKIASGQNPNVTNSLKAYTLADITATTPADRAILELTPVQDFATDVNSATSSEQAITKLGKYFNISSILSEINSNSENVINAATTTSAASQTGVKTTQDATTTTSEQRYKVSLIKDPNNNTKYITLVNGGKSAKIFLQTEFSDAFKKQYEGLPGIDAKHIDILEIPLTGFADSSTLASQFAAAPTLSYYAAPATTTTAATTPATQSEKMDLSQKDPLDWIFGYNSFFYYPNQEYKNKFAKIYIEAGLENPLTIQNFSFGQENATNKAAIDASLSKLKSDVKIDGNSLGLEYKDGKVVATATGTISVTSPEGTPLFTKDFTLTLDHFKTPGQSQLTNLINTIEKQDGVAKPAAQQQGTGGGAGSHGSTTTQPTNSNESTPLLFEKDHKFGSGTLDFNSISSALSLGHSEDIKNIFADPTTTNVRFYTGERLEALTSKFALPTTEQIKNSFSLDTSKTNKIGGYFNIKSSFLPTDLSVSRYYFALVNQGLDVAAQQLLEILKATDLLKKPDAAKLDLSKPIFNQLKNIELKDVDAQTSGDKTNDMKVFTINQEGQKNSVLLLQSGLVNPKNNVAYGKIGDTKESDFQVLNSLLALDPKDIANIGTEAANLQSFTNAAQLLIALYAKVKLLSTPILGFPLLPIGKGVQVNYNFEVKPSSGGAATQQVTQSTQNNFEYKYTLGFEGNEKALFESTENTTTLASIQVGAGTEKPVVAELNQVVKTIPSFYNRISVSSDDYGKLSTYVTNGQEVSATNLSKLGLDGLNTYLTSLDLGITLVGDAAKAVNSLDQYTVITLNLKKGEDKSTDSIKIFVYKRVADATSKNTINNEYLDDKAIATPKSNTESQEAHSQGTGAARS